ncbi:MAG TPA: hypothetical protein VEO54_21795 [Thermoanaerobaculia bacterium]|nr:hypothetical protein [Thermoanaerobaculia bacterium]
MEVKHCSSTDFERIRGGAASAAETAAVGRHVAECAECQALAGRALSLVDSAAALRAALAVEEETPSRRWIWISLAAAAVIAAVLFFLPRAERGDGLQPVPRRAEARPHVPPPEIPRVVHPLIAEVRKTSVLPFPADIRALAEGDTFRGGGKEGRAEEQVWPAATAVAETRPELRWPAMPGARFVVSLGVQGDEVARSGPLTRPRWRAPELRRGATYRWQVSAERGEESLVIPAPPAPPAIFRVLSRREHEALTRAIDDADSDRLLRGLLYASAGLVEEARRELQTYERESRDPLAERLLRQLP